MSGTSGITAPQRRLSASRLALGALPSAVPCARAHTTALLAMWGLTRVADSAELVVCELITNAITHGSGGAGGRGPIPVVHLDLSTDLARLRIDVWDTSPRAPVLRPDVPDSAEGGRGLLLVDALCETWGADRVPGWPGKRVRAVLVIPQEPHEKPGMP
jgi:anti-sigma regulatory factor (Ser/Thr protein kinase)